jgi:hypothetical protein
MQENAGTFEALAWDEHDKLSDIIKRKDTKLVEHCIAIAKHLNPKLTVLNAQLAGLQYAVAFEKADAEEGREDYPETKKHLVKFFSYVRPGLGEILGNNRGNWWLAAREDDVEVVETGLTKEYSILFDLDEDNDWVKGAVNDTINAWFAHDEKNMDRCKEHMTSAYARFK